MNISMIYRMDDFLKSPFFSCMLFPPILMPSIYIKWVDLTRNKARVNYSLFRKAYKRERHRWEYVGLMIDSSFLITSTFPSAVVSYKILLFRLCLNFQRSPKARIPLRRVSILVGSVQICFSGLNLWLILSKLSVWYD